ncbi:MAG: class I SAM-dependent methyltransferase [Alphaproteobacteria bacterium]
MVHKAATQGFSKAAATYQTGRPTYPKAALDWVQNTLGIAAHHIVLEMGAGTGKFTQCLAATNAHIIAADAVPEMLGELTKALPQTETLACTAEDIPLDDSSVDFVVCAQAFHWFATDKAVAEMRRILKPGGKLALIWNSRDQSCEWVEALSQIMRPYGGDAPRHDSGDWKKCFPAPGFTPLETASFPHSQTGPIEEVVVNRVLSTSFIAALNEADQAAVKAQVNALINRTPDLKDKAAVTFPYVTAAHHCVRL